VISRSIAACNVLPSERVLLLYGEDCLVSEHGQVFQFLRGYPAECHHFTLDINKAEGLTVYDDGQENDKDIILDPGQIPCRQMRLYPGSREVFDNKVCRFRYGHIENILLLFQREFEPLLSSPICTESELDLRLGFEIPQKEETFEFPQSSFRINGFEGDLAESRKWSSSRRYFNMAISKPTDLVIKDLSAAGIKPHLPAWYLDRIQDNVFVILLPIVINGKSLGPYLYRG